MCETQEYQKIIDGLNGSSDGLHIFLANIDRDELADNETFTAMLDDQIFKCAECDWWCEQGEAQAGLAGEDVCGDCAPAAADD